MTKEKCILRYSNEKGTIAAKHYPGQLDSGILSPELINDLYEDLYIYVDPDYKVHVTRKGNEWLLTLGDAEICEYVLGLDCDRLIVSLSMAVVAGFKSARIGLFNILAGSF